MALKLYYLKAKTKSPACAAVYQNRKSYDLIYQYAVSGEINSDGLPGFLSAECQPGVSESFFCKADYLHAHGGIPLFSQRFMELIAGVMSETLESYPTKVSANGIVRDFVIIKIKKKMHLVDYAKSGVLDDDFSRGIFIRNDIKEDFFLAREKNDLCHSVFLATQGFKEFALDNGLIVDFKEPSYS